MHCFTRWHHRTPCYRLQMASGVVSVALSWKHTFWSTICGCHVLLESNIVDKLVVVRKGNDKGDRCAFGEDTSQLKTKKPLARDSRKGLGWSHQPFKIYPHVVKRNQNIALSTDIAFISGSFDLCHYRPLKKWGVRLIGRIWHSI